MTFAALAEFLAENDLMLEVQCASGVWAARLRRRSGEWLTVTRAQDTTMLGAIVMAVKQALRT